MKWLKIALTVLMCAGLSACMGEEQIEQPLPEETPAAVQSASPIPVEPQPEPVETTREPEYIYLPSADLSEADEDYVFQGFISSEEGEKLGSFLDVSDSKNVITLDSFHGSGGEQVSVPLRACGQVELCAVDLEISYDTERLRYVGFENADDDLLVNCDEERGSIMVNFVRIVNIEDNFKFCDLLFEVITTLECESTLAVEVVEAVCVDDAGSIVFPSAASVDGIALLNQEGGG